ncbi:YbhB/YbcL family Raf kinase inhibitor-like protein [Sulfidibacter corallicola]|uniref:YbhB/YbcL family Raf kinase inhibitor-like protein n=1 Tax=Sulfidibacter corallicola TaxID=2818388 RepID=A0A8A4TNQ6_SULCO|nr:YbhB/YbcL family Raf kinase inhibitor-like protein [Sulfidibacter corallicola]QTD51606.1 YbhB/YbcL family Raf kinase inhibitor-like protein [Sulfidibacter corallicola]
MKLTLSSFADGAAIPGKYAFCVPAEEGHVAMSSNINPHLAWSGLPEGTKSLALICHDPDVPSVGDDVNQEGKTVPHDLPRVDFYHWVLVDMPATLTEIAEGAASNAVTARGKALGATPHGLAGYNDYTGWFAGDADMEGDYGNYDGPCPPWNDERLHHYVFTLYALDVETLGLSGRFGGGDAVKALEGHVLDKASWTGTYTLNPNVT